MLNCNAGNQFDPNIADIINGEENLGLIRHTLKPGITFGLKFGLA